MRSSIMTGVAIVGLLTTAATSARAGGGYGVYSGAGFNAVAGSPPPWTTVGVVAAALGWNGGSANPATIGIAANPMPVYGPAMWFRLRTGGYRVVPVE